MPDAARERKRAPLTESLVVRFTESEMQQIIDLADEKDCAQARVVRVAVQRLLEEEQATPSPSKKKRKQK